MAKLINTMAQQYGTRRKIKVQNVDLDVIIVLSGDVIEEVVDNKVVVLCFVPLMAHNLPKIKNSMTVVINAKASLKDVAKYFEFVKHRMI